MAAKKSGLTYDALLKDLKAEKFAPIYFLQGDEPYYIDLLSNYFEQKVLDETEKAFNLTVLYGRDIDHLAVIDQARRFPMMSRYQVVVIREAQYMRDLTQLEKYVENPAVETLLVICYKHKKLDKRTKFAKQLLSSGILFESKRIYANQIPGWITKYLKKKKLSIANKEANLIAEYLGSDLAKISNELDKMILNIEREDITQEDIEKYIGISKDYNIFELQAALGSKNANKAYRIIRYFIRDPKNHPMVLIISGLYNYFSKIYLLHGLGNASQREVMQTLRLSSPYFVEEYRLAQHNYSTAKTESVIRLLRNYDLRSKGVGNDHFSHDALLQEMIYRILAL